jgi:hypothetical protein
MQAADTFDFVQDTVGFKDKMAAGERRLNPASSP